jgi:Tfp pilus assembly protein FimT
MVVLVVLGILLATAVPSLTERNARSRTEGAARQLSARMQAARQLAVSKRIPYRMTFDLESRSYYFERQDDDSTWTMDPDETYAIEGVEEIATEIGGRVGESLVHFETRGTIDGDDSPALVTIVSAHGDTARLSVVRTGRATVLMSH